ncbi:hypothetical protein [Streptomyces sp. NPDC088789]|uniref:hypothetical protein n=1 Tax=Streptomyces sp. NPDC088789 TaxID=3365899 RepID=UPI00381794BD
MTRSRPSPLPGPSGSAPYSRVRAGLGTVTLCAGLILGAAYDTQAAEHAPVPTPAAHRAPEPSPATRYTPQPAAAAKRAPGPVDEPSRAGSGAGQGRERPGRGGEPPARATPGERDDAGVPPVPDGTESGAPPYRDDSAPDNAGASDVGGTERPTEPALRILPLGSGLILIGFGLGLAFLGLRLRRG